MDAYPYTFAPEHPAVFLAVLALWAAVLAGVAWVDYVRPWLGRWKR